MDRHALRRDRLRRRSAKCADAILVTNFTNVSYLTGFTGDDSYLLLAGGAAAIVSDPRYTTQLEEECPDVDLHIRPPGVSMTAAVERVVKAARVRRLAIEADSMSVSLRDEFAGALRKTEIVATSGLVEGLREVKDKTEIEAIREAVTFAEKGFAVLRATLRPNRTEKEVADDLEHQLRLLGAAGTSFPPIVAVGARAALPHATPTAGRIGESDFVLIDWGATGRQYKSDLTRVLVTGRISPKLKRVYGVVLKAQLRAIAAIRPGMTGHEVDAVARRVIADAGFGRRFGHGLGHGIGLEIHEGPRLARNDHRPLKAGMVVTVEPGVYLPGWGGVRIEDDVLVTRGGHEVLSHVAKKLDEVVLD